MKLAIVILAVVGMTMACDSNNKKTRDEFEAFRRQYRKNYQSTAEEDYRCSVFAENYIKVEEHNQRQARGLETYTVAINKFSDYTHEEFIRMFTGFKPELEQKTRVDLTAKTVREYNANIKAPASINWDEKGFVTPVKNQGRCGSCYSFASNAVAESRFLISKNTPYAWKDLSEQQVVECSTAYGNQKCNGGLMTNTFRYWIQENHGCNVEDHYPYVSAEGSNGTECKYVHDKSAFRVTGFTELARDDKVLEQAVAEGPVAVGVNADTWANYESGIFCPKNVLGLLSGCSMLGLNHAVVVVGYTADYWIIKNSWGPLWGEGGFIRLCRKFTNNCGINMMCSYPHV